MIVRNGRIANITPLPAAGDDLPVISPGFIDSHTHPLELGLQALFADLAAAESIPAVLDRLRDRLAALDRPPVMLGLNLDPDRLAESRYPTCSELDLVDNHVPMLVYRVDGHSAALNTPGLELALGDSEPDGVELDAGGHRTGVLRGTSYERSSRAFKRRLGPDIVRSALEAASRIALASGTTTIAALVGTDDLTEADWQVLVDTLAGLEVRAVPFLQTLKPVLARRFGLPRIGGCLLVDGSFGSHTAALEQDYADSPGNLGRLYYDDDSLLTFFRGSDELELQTAVHAIGDRAVGQVIRCHRQVAVLSNANPLRHRIEHAELLTPAMVDMIADLELVLGVQPAFEACWGGPDRLYDHRLGERWRRTNPYRTLLDAGVVLAGGSDAPITPIDPLGGIRAALEHPNPEQRVTGTEALNMFTTAAAYSLGLEMRVGQLDHGYAADFVVLDCDPRSGHACRPLTTYRAGRKVHENTGATS